MKLHALLSMGLNYQDLQVIPAEEADALLVLQQEINKKEKEDSKRMK